MLHIFGCVIRLFSLLIYLVRCPPPHPAPPERERERERERYVGTKTFSLSVFYLSVSLSLCLCLSLSVCLSQIHQNACLWCNSTYHFQSEPFPTWCSPGPVTRPDSPSLCNDGDVNCRAFDRVQPPPPHITRRSNSPVVLKPSHVASEPESPTLVLRPGTLKQGLTYLVQVTVSDPGECCACVDHLMMMR